MCVNVPYSKMFPSFKRERENSNSFPEKSSEAPNNQFSIFNFVSEEKGDRVLQSDGRTFKKHGGGEADLLHRRPRQGIGGTARPQQPLILSPTKPLSLFLFPFSPSRRSLLPPRFVPIPFF